MTQCLVQILETRDELGINPQRLYRMRALAPDHRDYCYRGRVCSTSFEKRSLA